MTNTIYITSNKNRSFTYDAAGNRMLGTTEAIIVHPEQTNSIELCCNWRNNF